jgi:mono/diheme cytochrome c family protein
MTVHRTRSSIATLIGAALAIASPLASSGEPAADAAAAKLAHGKYLVTIAGCNDCHTPLVMGPDGPERDMTRMLSGHPESLVMPPRPVLPEGPWGAVAAATFTAWSGPWGVSFTANLTPDPETGSANGPCRISGTPCAPAGAWAAAARSCRRCRSRCTRTSPTTTSNRYSRICSRSGGEESRAGAAAAAGGACGEIVAHDLVGQFGIQQPDDLVQVRRRAVYTSITFGLDNFTLDDDSEELAVLEKR